MKKAILKQEVERTFGRQLTETRDFEQLSHLLLSHTRERLSPTTLKRLWGYLKNEEVQTRPHTLDVLARFVGYKGYEDFCAQTERLDEVQSGIKTEEKITTEGLRRGQRLIITWRPDRKIVVRLFHGLTHGIHDRILMLCLCLRLKFLKELLFCLLS